MPWRRGALFVGPPGNGKTLCVKVLVRRLAVPCIYVQSFEAPYGTPQHSIEAVFRRARATAPCLVILLEDLDALVTEGCRSFFLYQLDGFAGTPASSRSPRRTTPSASIPAIVERPSRFDSCEYHFDLPQAETRVRYSPPGTSLRLRPALRLSESGAHAGSPKTRRLLVRVHPGGLRVVDDALDGRAR